MKVLVEFENKPLLFRDPDYIISCSDPSLFRLAFDKIEEALRQGYFLAGFFSYEAGRCFEKKLSSAVKSGFPLIYLGAYRGFHRGRMGEEGGGFRLENPRLNIGRTEYSADIEAIRDDIARGNVYQVTYCIKFNFEFRGGPFSLYCRLLKEQPVPYPAYLEAEAFQILSLSPELFIKKSSSFLMSKPMKGTWPCGRGFLSDLAAPLRLKYDPKNRAENVMIADLLRNDLGRMGNDVRAPALFEVARYKTLCQMTSTVTAAIDKDLPVYDLFSAVFPSGSVTGAPKISAMDIIGRLENEERKIYTGAIGFIRPDRDMFFNIPIRTILIPGKISPSAFRPAEMGIGGGIVWDSTPEGEWNEGLFKARFLTDLFPGTSFQGTPCCSITV